MNYIVNKGCSVSTKRGIIGSPKDPENPTREEIITANDFETGEKSIEHLLNHKNKPITPYEPEEKLPDDKGGDGEGGGDKTNTKSQQLTEKNKLKTGAEKK